jgi:deazaflavin-dependent oxidoreductase (nitroreductase family)
MNEQSPSPVKIPEPPRGVKAIPWRLPIWLYRLKLGFLLGHRFLLLTHIGRVSGEPRQAVLEVVHYDAESDTHYVASGFGEKSQWYRNLMKTPDVTIQIGNQKTPVTAERLSPEEAERILRIYRQEHPRALKELSKILGYELDGTEENFRAFTHAVPVIAFRPR